MQLGLSILHNYFSQIIGPSFWGNGPKHVRQVLKPKLVGGFHSAQLRLDLKASSLAFDSGFATCLWHKLGTVQIDPSRSASMPVIDRFGRARDHIGGEHWGLRHRLDLRLRWWLVCLPCGVRL